MNLEKITVNDLIFDFTKKNGVINLSRLDYYDFYEKSEKFNKFSAYLEKIFSSALFMPEGINIEIIIDFSDDYSYLISNSAENSSCLEVVYKKNSPIYIKDNEGNYSTTLKSSYGSEGNFAKNSSLTIRYFKEKGQEIYHLLQDLYFVDINRKFISLYEIKAFFPPDIRNNFLVILNEMIQVCGLENYSDVSMEGFIIKDSYIIPFSAESEGIKKLCWIYPWMWLSKVKKKKIIFYGGFLDDGLHPLLVRHLVLRHTGIIALLCHS